MVVEKNILTDIEKATVKILKKTGQGVLVNNNLIITAAHCIDFKIDGEMVLGYDFIENIEAGGKELKVTPLAVEPVNDIAVLGSLDDQVFFKEAEDFEAFCKKTKPVLLCRSEFELSQKFKVHIYTHEEKWITGSAMQACEDAQMLFVEADEQIKGGTSGGPVINDAGELVGIVSHFSEVNDSQRKSSGLVPRPHIVLPVWVCNRIFNFGG